MEQIGPIASLKVAAPLASMSHSKLNYGGAKQAHQGEIKTR